MFEDQANQAIKRLSNMANGRPGEQIAQAHALKSMCLSAGADRAGHAAAQIEQELKEAAPQAEKLTSEPSMRSKKRSVK